VPRARFKVFGKYFVCKVGEGAKDKYIYTVAQVCEFSVGIY